MDDFAGDVRRLLQHEPQRRSGVEAIGDIPWGTHLCVLYQTAEELLEVVVPYFARGLADNEFCMWVTSDLVDVEHAKAALGAVVPNLDACIESGQLEIIRYTDWYLREGRFDANSVLCGWADKVAKAEDRGFEGLRLSGDTFWLEKATWQGFRHYEEMVDRLIGAMRILAVCAYPVTECSLREVLDIIANHDFALHKEDGRWLSFKSSSRHRLGQALRESEGRRQAILEAVQDAIVAFDTSGSIYSINAAGARMFGYDPRELRKADIRLILPDKRAMHFAVSPSSSRQQKFRSSGETKGRRKNGELFPVELTLTATRQNDAALLVGIIRDLSEKHEAEARLKRIQIDRLAAMGGIAAGLAHELNQPLSAMKTYIKIAERMIDAPPDRRPVNVKDALARAGEQVERAGRIISSLRGLALHGEANKLIQSIHALIRKTCECFAASLADQDISLVLNLDAKKDMVLVDGVQIQQVLTNLIKNAIEAMAASETRCLTVSTSMPEDGRIQVDVADSGQGIPNEIKSQLFEPAPSTKIGGMGIGLPMSRAIIEAHDGRIWARADLGQGAVFSFTLPLLEAINLDGGATA